jgi:outer membrane protein assembly factor BamD (BamD/ComL family)
VPTTIEGETHLLRDGLAALHAGDPARALALFDEHARRYASGVLAEERSAERVVALHDLGRVVEANQAAAAFLRDHPRSPLRARVRAACAPAPNR